MFSAHEIQIDFHIGEECLQLIFMEATGEETLEFLEKFETNETLGEWIVDFVYKHAFCHDESKKDWLCNQLLLSGDILFEKIAWKYYGLDFSKTQDRSENGSILPTQHPRSLQHFVVSIAKEVGLDPITLLQRYSWRAIGELAESLIWNANEATEEGRKKNKQALTKINFELHKESILNKMQEVDKILQNAYHGQNLRTDGAENGPSVIQ